MSNLLDLTGLKCPLPALKTRKALKNLESKTTLTVITTDPLAVLDIQALLNETGDNLLSITPQDLGHRFEIEKA